MITEADLMVMSDEAHHYLQLQDVPLHIQKYWRNRYNIFSYYNNGVYMTDDAWFGVTPEPVARRIAMDMPHPDAVANGHFESWDRLRPTVIDAFAGAGGNTIQFALSGRWSRVIGIERDRATLACAQNNAQVAGVPEGVIIWLHGDCFDILPRLQAGEHVALFAGDETGNYVIHSDTERSPRYTYRLDSRETVVFASPPWGGVGYDDHAVFDLSTMEPYNLEALSELCSPLAFALYLPRTSNLQQLADLFIQRRDVEEPQLLSTIAAEEAADAAAADAFAAAAAAAGHRLQRIQTLELVSECKLDVMQYCMHGFSKALVAYYPAGGHPNNLTLSVEADADDESDFDMA